VKKLQDTKIGQILKEKAPQVFEVAKNLLPDKGLLGVVKNLVSQSNISKEDKEQIHKAAYRVLRVRGTRQRQRKR